MSDAAFREALDALEELAVEGAKQSQGYTSDLDWGQRYDAARARVLALYAERQGEVYEVQCLDYTPTLLPNDKDTAPKTIRLNHVFVGPQFKPGDRVRVTKVEEGQ